MDQLATIEATWSDGTSFLADFTDGEPATVVVADAAPSVGEVGVVHPLLVRIDDRDLEFRVHAKVASRRGDGSLVLKFLSEERDRLELILIAAKGESIPYRRRRHQRVTCQFPVTIVTDGGQSIRGTATEISAGGTHVSLESPLPGDQNVTVGLELGGKSVELAARLTDKISSGPGQGNGIEFLFRSAEERELVGQAVAALKDPPE